MRTLTTLISILMLCSVVKSQSLNVNVYRVHIASCDNQSGILRAVATGGDGNYTYLWDNGSTNDSIFDLAIGTYSVTVFSDGESAVGSRTLEPFGIGYVSANHVCTGDLGSIGLNDYSLNHPWDFTWYMGSTVLSSTAHFVTDITAGEYHWSVVDAEGCTDSGSVTIVASDPVMEIYLPDSSLCYQQTTQVWYTPGFTVYDQWNEYNTSVDTLLYTNQILNPEYLPETGMDEFGCWSPVVNPTWIYLEPYPGDPIPLYQYNDTLTLHYPVETAAHPTSTFRWHSFWNTIVVNSFSYLVIDSGGSYGVIETNQYGCTLGSSIDAELTGIEVPAETRLLSVYPNPMVGDDKWHVELSSSKSTVPLSLLDVQGRLIWKKNISGSKFIFDAPVKSGTYFLQLGTSTVKLIRQ